MKETESGKPSARFLRILNLEVWAFLGEAISLLESMRPVPALPVAGSCAATPPKRLHCLATTRAPLLFFGSALVVVVSIAIVV